MATNPLTAGFDSAIAETNKEIVAAPGVGKRIVALGGEASTDTAIKATVHFDTGDNVDDRILGGQFAAGGGSASLRGRVEGPENTALNYTSSGAAAQTVFIRYKIEEI